MIESVYGRGCAVPFLTAASYQPVVPRFSDLRGAGHVMVACTPSGSGIVGVVGGGVTT